MKKRLYVLKLDITFPIEGEEGEKLKAKEKALEKFRNKSKEIDKHDFEITKTYDENEYEKKSKEEDYV